MHAIRLRATGWRRLDHTSNGDYADRKHAGNPGGRGDASMAADAATVQALGSTDLFSSLSSRSLKTVAAGAKVIKHPAGQQLVTEGGEGVGFHLIVEGTVSVSIGGKPRAQLGAGEYFGEISMIDGGPRSATITTETPVTLIFLSSWNFRPMLEAEPEIARALLVVVCARLRAAEKRAQEHA
jgi:CRP/FNR family transcriptional regulator, cyclic AMP receptor protein